MLSFLSREAINAVFSGVSIFAAIILSIAVLVFTSNIYIKSLSFY